MEIELLVFGSWFIVSLVSEPVKDGGRVHDDGDIRARANPRWLLREMCRAFLLCRKEELNCPAARRRGGGIGLGKTTASTLLPRSETLQKHIGWLPFLVMTLRQGSMPPIVT